MKHKTHLFKNIFYSLTILFLAFLASEFIQHVFNVNENIPAIFIFAVFLISFVTDGYCYGIVSAFLVPFIMNYAFTPPFFVFNFHEVANIVSSFTLIIISILTSMMTVKIKTHEKEKLRANLLRAISHDLRTPLTNIYGSASILLENKENISPLQQQALLQGIKEDSNWLVHMVENLLSITKISNGGIELSKKTIVLDELIDDVVLKLKKQYPEQKVTLELPEEIVMIPMDILLIEQVLLNILENAIIHAHTMTRLILRVYIKDKKAIFEIEDNGCGMSSHQLKNLFKGYLGSGEQISDGKKHNMGIGMSVCSSILKAHGSEIFAENVKTGGTLFRFSLPVEETIYE